MRDILAADYKADRDLLWESSHHIERDGPAEGKERTPVALKYCTETHHGGGSESAATPVANHGRGNTSTCLFPYPSTESLIDRTQTRVTDHPWGG
jgi:hypothetical protein